MTKNKPIGLSFVDKQVKELAKTEKYYLDVEKGEFINYFPTFATDKIDDVLAEVVTSIEQCKQNKIDLLQTNSEIIKYTHFLIIKHFTSLKGELEGKSIEVHISTLEKLYKSGLFELFTVDMFDELEIQKVIDKVWEIEKFAVKYKDELMKRRQIIEENTTNDFLKEKLLQKLED